MVHQTRYKILFQIFHTPRVECVVWNLLRVNPHKTNPVYWNVDLDYMNRPLNNKFSLKYTLDNQV